MVRRVRLIFYACSLVLALGQAAVAQQPLRLFDLSSQAETDPAAAVEAIDDLITTQEVTDPRSLFDLQRLKADLLERRLERPAEAAVLYLQLARAAQRDRVRLQEDPIALMDRAAVLYLGLGDSRRAERAVLQILDEQRDGGADADAIAQTLERLAQMTTGAASTRYAEAAVLARTTPAPTRSTTDTGGFRAVEVFYATDRARTGNSRPSRFYGGARGDLELGVATVTIPDTHVSGALESRSIWRLEFAQNPAKHIVLKSVVPEAPDQFWDRMRGKLSDSDTADAFVFVHGFNVRFDAAARRAAQMAHDMNFPGVPVLYSWPSRGTTMGYIADTAVVRLSGRRLSRFLEDLVEKSGAETVHIVAHSMGNRALTDALELLALRQGIAPGDTPLFDQVLFAAPDVDADLFAEMMPVIRPLAERLTLYASEQDWALETSKQLHGNAPRAGQGGEDMVAYKEFDSIDMSALGEDMLAHSYFADDSSALADMVALFWRNAPPKQRCGLQPRQTEAEIAVWTYIVGPCADQTLVDVMAHLREAEVSDAEAARKIVAEKVPDPQLAQTLVPIVSNLLAD